MLAVGVASLVAWLLGDAIVGSVSPFFAAVVVSAWFGGLRPDIRMPGESGYDLILRVRARDRDARTPAVALTAYPRVEDRARALAAGYDMHVPKPVSPVALARAIAALAARE